MQPCIVVDSVAGDDLTVGDQALVVDPPFCLVVVVGGATTGQKSKTVEGAESAWNRISVSLLEPADSSGAGARQGNALRPRLAQKLIYPSFPLQGEHRLRIATAHVDDILRQQKIGYVGSMGLEK